VNGESVLSRQPQSYWVVTAPGETYPALAGEVQVDVAIIGAGIVGVTAALLLKRSGRTVALIEAGRVLRGVTGYTTAKVTSSHHLIYAELERVHGGEAARLYGRANQAAIDFIASTCERECIECDLARLDNYTFTEAPDQLERLREEAEVAARLGLPASFVPEAPLPFPIAGAVRFANQAQFHPRKYLLPLVAGLRGGGSFVFEDSRIVDVDEGESCRISSDAGTVLARDVIVATHFPILDRGGFFARQTPRREYVVASPAPADPPKAMFVEVGGGGHTVRWVDSPEGPLAIIGGEDHKTGNASDTSERYERLEAYGRERLGCGPARYRWSTQDNDSFDRLPYVGKLHPLSGHLYAATGFGGWGMTNGTVAAMILSDLIVGRENPWADLYSPNRLKLGVAGKEMLREGAQDAGHLVAGRLTARSPSAADWLAPGEGLVVKPGLRPIAVHRDEAGQLHAVSAVCTHMGCVVTWNRAEQSWDCPCHGSRFDASGRVLHGPATRALGEASLEEGGMPAG
jgi:glycine/D-amino acid oxidase-like deaminating enzyme/nitrite reductase/ring-hydroxylating ferredoxin subunit